MEIEKIQRLFTDIKKNVNGLLGLLLITEDGFPIISTLEAGEEEIRSTAVGAILCDSGQRGIRELNLGEFEAVITLGTEGYFVLTRIREGAILMALASHDVALGMVLLKIRKVKPEIMKAFEDS